MNYKLTEREPVWFLYDLNFNVHQAQKVGAIGHTSRDSEYTTVKFKIFKSKLLQVMFL